MKYLINELETLQGRLSNLPLLLMLDFDGTLAPIVARPELAVLPARTHRLLGALAGVRSCRLAVISGRSLADIRQRVNVEGIVYAGNHGLEIEGPGISYRVAVGPDYLQALERIQRELYVLAAGFPGCLIEDKGVSLSLHFRQLDPERIMPLREAFGSLIKPYQVARQVRVKSGKMVFEVYPPVDWDKGKAVLWLLDKWQAEAELARAVAWYCGDDATDEDAFRALAGSNGIGVVVGCAKDSSAQYYLHSPDEVAGFLGEVARLKGKPL